MTRTFLVGFDGSPGARDALVLGEMLARPLDAALIAACVYVFRPIHREGGDEFEAMLRERARRCVEPAADLVGGPAPETRVVRGHSAAAGLHDLASVADADLIVIGSTHHGPLGRVMTRGMPEALLHDAPCAVAVAPRGYASVRTRALRTIGVGFDGGVEAQVALRHAADIARAARARLEVIAALDPVNERPAPHSLDVQRRFEHDASLRRVLERDLDYAVADLGYPAATAVTLEGPAVEALTQRSQQLDLLVLGSRCYGALRRVLLGSVSGPVLHHASSPVVVVPRSGAERASSPPAEAVERARA